MRFDHIDVHGVRNLEKVSLDVGAGCNFFHGANGAGKTALLEALHILCRGRSFRTSTLSDVLTRGVADMVIRASITDEIRGGCSIALRKVPRGPTESRIDGQRQQRMSDTARLTPLQLILPDVAQLIFGSPEQRRTWLDWGLFHVEPDYVSLQRQFVHVLRQRNALLRQDRSDVGELRGWTDQYVELAERVTAKRASYLEKLEPHVNSALLKMAPELSLELEYRRGWSDGQDLDKVLGESRTREVKLSATQWGPHRAEIRIRSGDEKASAVLSRGQGKAAATALNIGQAALLASQTQRSAVFLIDEMGAELDVDYNARFFQLLQELGSQVLATSAHAPVTELGFEKDRFHMFHVKHGQFSAA